jgi:hypothetical protein
LGSSFPRRRERRIFSVPISFRVPHKYHITGRTEILRAARTRPGDTAKGTYSEENCEQQMAKRAVESFDKIPKELFDC